MARKSLRKTLLQAAAVGTLAAMAVFTPTKAMAACDVNGGTADCDSDVNPGTISYSDGSISTLNIHDLNNPLVSQLGLIPAVQLYQQQKNFFLIPPGPLRLNLDDSVVVNASTPFGAVRVQAAGDASYNPFDTNSFSDGTARGVSVISAATINYNSLLAETTRAAAAGQPGLLDLYANNIDYGNSVREALQKEIADRTAQDNALIDGWKCKLALGSLCGFVQGSFPSLLPGILAGVDPNVVMPSILDYISVNRENLNYWSAPPPPEDIYVFGAAITALSIGTGVNNPIRGGFGFGGAIDVTNTGTITTTGANAMGIFAHSQGGERATTGTGGAIHVTNDGDIITNGGSAVGVFARSVGAADDLGSTGGHVLIEGNGNIITYGHSAYGVYAMSRGGDGRNDATWRAGNGGLAEIVYGGAIETNGVNAIGIYALSQGGLGWEGGDGSVSDAANPGGWGGDGGDVEIEILQGASVVTYGDSATAILARSRGNTGGEGGHTNQLGAGPGVGGPGGVAGDVDVINRGLIQTFGANAYGVWAHSQAGAGGNGGNHDNLLEGTGQRGGPAGHGGDVHVDNFGAITTAGRRSFAIYAQSMGGNGGAGGDGAGAFDSSGGSGGSAESGRCLIEGVCPDGGDVRVTNHRGALIATEGLGAHGIFTQSIGGGGGQGGDADGWLWISGGAGGDAGDGGFVITTNNAEIATLGVGAYGILSQSIGGGGGFGGDAFGVGPYASITIGGNGGAGGNGGMVWARNSGVIYALGERSNGIFAQSIGGGGGVGGSATAIGVGAGVSASVAIGGNGGTGGNGDRVDVENSGAVNVWGDFSNGIFAQSVGGGGGSGGSSYSYSLAGGDQFSLAVAIALGGAGARGGDGGTVDVNNSGSIVTYDFNSIGVFAQSVGGGGGIGGSSMAQSVSGNARKGVELRVSVAVGGRGGDGGVGGDVTVENEGSIATIGDQSTGVFAQSVGGGGGLGGDASTGSTSLSQGNSTSIDVDVSVGGNAGDGDDGGDVTVTNRAGANIVTLGAMANGITAQSVGGGGGIGGTADQSSLFESLGLPEPPELGFEDSSDQGRRNARQRYGDLQDEVGDIDETSGSHGRRGKKQSKPEPTSFGIGLSIGGKGGAGGDGRTVTVENAGEILTGGIMSMGVFAQSVGGGGGMGGTGRGSAVGDVSFGGGIGGTGGSAGHGGRVTVENSGAVTTLQALSYGIFAQSVGGGGGIGGLGPGEHDTQTSFSLSIGGRGGSSGVGGDVDVHQTGDVITFGNGAIGVLAQSVGGGGGIGGSAEESTWGSINLGGGGGGGGDGGQVFVGVDGNIATEGNYAHGVFAQSVGGGGGMGGNVESRSITISDPFGLIEIDTGIALSVGNLGVGGAGGSAGDGEDVIVETTGNISTFGRNAHGIFAQSVGGGGGAGGSASGATGLSLGFSGSAGGAGTAGDITITHDGDIRTYGANSIGIFAQSMGGAGSGFRGGDIRILLDGGEIRGGSGEAGAGIFVSGGKTNVIINEGGLISAASGIAIAATDGDDHLENYGRIEGSVGLGGGSNSFLNGEAGVFASGRAVNIGGGPLMNLGELTPFSELTGETIIAGAYVQQSTGLLTVDLNFGGASDRVTVQGAATLAGAVNPIVGHVADLQPNTYVTVLTANSILNQGVSVDLADTLVVDFATRISGNNFQIGVASIDYDIGELSEAQQQIANHLQGIWTAGGTDSLHALMDYLGGLKSAAAYRATLDGVSPFASLTGGVQPVNSTWTFLGGLMSCPDADLHETACGWVRGGERDAEMDADGGDPAYRQDFAALPSWRAVRSTRWLVRRLLAWLRAQRVHLRRHRAHRKRCLHAGRCRETRNGRLVARSRARSLANAPQTSAPGRVSCVNGRHQPKQRQHRRRALTRRAPVRSRRLLLPSQRRSRRLRHLHRRLHRRGCGRAQSHRRGRRALHGLAHRRARVRRAMADRRFRAAAVHAVRRHRQHRRLDRPLRALRSRTRGRARLHRLQPHPRRDRQRPRRPRLALRRRRLAPRSRTTHRRRLRGSLLHGEVAVRVLSLGAATR